MFVSVVFSLSRSDAAKPVGKPSFQRYEPYRATNGVAKTYDPSTDVVVSEEGGKKQKKHHLSGAKEAEEKPKKKKRVKTEEE